MLKPLANRWLTEHLVMKKLLTDRLLRALKRGPPSKRTLVWDSTVPGLCVIVTPAGKITFAVVKRLPGGSVPVTWRGLDYPATSLADGRKWGQEVTRDIAAGID